MPELIEVDTEFHDVGAVRRNPKFVAEAIGEPAI
jgi:hypothetical protein